MKIALLISSLTGGGAERVTCNLANFLYKKENDVTIITMSDIDDTYKASDGIKRLYLLHRDERSNKIKDNLLRYKRLKRFVKDNHDIDCYVVMLPITTFMLCSLKKYTKAKIIVSDRVNPTSYNFVSKRIMKYAEKRCDGLVVQTNEISKWYNHHNMVIIPNAINNDVIINRKNKSRDNRIVSVGRLTDQKNYPLLINAFSKIAKEFPKYTLEIYGQGPLENSLKQLTIDLGIDDKVVFKGYVKNVNEQIIDARLFVMTSNYEGMPNALIEAMCLGLPCISTDCDGGGSRELINNDVNGILVDKGDEKGLIDAMKKILSNDNYSKNIEKHALELRKTLDYEIIYNMWYDFIKKDK